MKGQSTRILRAATRFRVTSDDGCLTSLVCLNPLNAQTPRRNPDANYGPCVSEGSSTGQARRSPLGGDAGGGRGCGGGAGGTGDISGLSLNGAELKTALKVYWKNSSIRRCNGCLWKWRRAMRSGRGSGLAVHKKGLVCFLFLHPGASHSARKI